MLRVYETFYAALTADQGVRVATEGVDIAERHLDLAKVRFEAGSAARLDVLRAEVELANARATLIRARSSAYVAYQAVRSVLSLPQSDPLQLAGSLDDVPSLPDGPVLEGAIASRPDIRAIGQQREAAQRQVSLANAERMPTVALSGSFQYQEDGLDSLLDGSSRSYQFGLGVRVPLFNGPTVSARRAAASARVRQAEHGVNAALDTARLELASASTALEGARGDRRHSAESCGTGTRRAFHRRGVVRERCHHRHRIERRPSLTRRDRVGTDAGQVRSDCRRGPDAPRCGPLARRQPPLQATEARRHRDSKGSTLGTQCL